MRASKVFVQANDMKMVVISFLLCFLSPHGCMYKIHNKILLPIRTKCEGAPSDSL